MSQETALKDVHFSRKADRQLFSMALQKKHRTMIGQEARKGSGKGRNCNKREEPELSLKKARVERERKGKERRKIRTEENATK